MSPVAGVELGIDADREFRQAFTVGHAGFRVGGTGHFLHGADLGIRTRDACDLRPGQGHRRRRGGKLQHGPWPVERAAKREVELLGEALAGAVHRVEHLLFFGQLGFHAERVAAGAHRVGGHLTGVFDDGGQPGDLRLLESERLVGEGEFDGVAGGLGTCGECRSAGVFHGGALHGFGLTALSIEHARAWAGLAPLRP